jgi:hypothetical protein
VIGVGCRVPLEKDFAMEEKVVSMTQTWARSLEWLKPSLNQRRSRALGESVPFAPAGGGQLQLSALGCRKSALKFLAKHFCLDLGE